MKRRCTDEVIEAAWERAWCNAQHDRKTARITAQQAQELIDALRVHDARNASLNKRGMA